ncbi:MAG: glycosyltransferase family 2 protein [Sinobacteraceae bacterium]|nr:glycosyltransferase family 2 protein [Nevskiaceae bacterium]
MTQSHSSPVHPTVSVLIAAYNAAGFLERAVQSALLQSRSPLEVIIVDDGSTDDTVAVIRKLMIRDARIRLVTLRENGGPAAARNAGLTEVRGEWVAILDADDAFVPERLETLLRYALPVHADVVVDNFCYYNAMSGVTGPPVLGAGSGVSQISFAEFLAHARPFTGEVDWGLLKPLFRTEFLRQHRLRYPVESRHGEDFLLLAQAFLCGACYLLVREPGYLYTGRSSNLSRSRLDYHAMYRHTHALLSDPRVRANPLWTAGVRERAKAVRRLAAVTDFERFQRQSDYHGMLQRICQDPSFRLLVARKLLRLVLQPRGSRTAPG